LVPVVVPGLWADLRFVRRFLWGSIDERVLARRFNADSDGDSDAVERVVAWDKVIRDSAAAVESAELPWASTRLMMESKSDSHDGEDGESGTSEHLPGEVVGTAKEPSSKTPATSPAVSMLEGIPCVEVDWRTGLWSIASLPSASAVTSFFNQLVAATGLPTVDDSQIPGINAVSSQWALFESSEVGAASLPSNSWASLDLSDEEENLVGIAAAILGGKFTAGLLWASMLTGRFPASAGWGAVPRGTLARFLDRVQLNFVVSSRRSAFLEGSLTNPNGDVYRRVYEIVEDVGAPVSSYAYRVGNWIDSSLVQQPPQSTFIAKMHHSNPYVKLRSNMIQDSLGTPLSKLIGMEGLPENWALPILWSEAEVSGVFRGQFAGFPKSTHEDKKGTEVQEAVRNVASEIDKLIATGGKDLGGLTVAQVFGVLLAFGGITSPPIVPGLGSFTGATVLLGVLLVAVGWEINEAFEDLPEALRKAVEDENAYHEAVYWLLRGLSDIDLQGLIGKIDDLAGKIAHLVGDESTSLDGLAFLHGLDGDELWTLAQAFESGGTNSPDPIILLGDCFEEYASSFRATFSRWAIPATASFTEGSYVLPSHHEDYHDVAEAVAELFVAIQPTYDAAVVFDLVGMLVAQLLKLDDELVALADWIVVKGLIGDLVTAALVEGGFGMILEALGGVTPSDIVRFYVRQVLTDNFIEYVGTTEDIDASCLHDVFCWMRRKEQRDALEAALGAPEPFELDRDVLVEAMALQFVPDLPSIVLRYGGAMKRIVEDIGASTSSSLSEIVDLADVGSMRAWLRTARDDSCLKDLRGAWVPDLGEPESESGWPANVFEDPKVVMAMPGHLGYGADDSSDEKTEVVAGVHIVDREDP